MRLSINPPMCMFTQDPLRVKIFRRENKCGGPTIANRTMANMITDINSVQVNISAESGDMGILSNHVPSIEQLRPGPIEIIEENGQTKKFFLAGGFAVVQPNSTLSINAVEGFPLEDFSSEAIKSQIGEAQKIAAGSGSEQDIAEAKIELEVLESLQAAMK
ncbi:delta subunit of the central stalk of mitochondrial F1F0 ATP synthase, atp16 [Ophidiomyces ophidiicola]|nr:delta subunit of the central stalk of mitochondrial F1F0 ATP synthase, atp16 [Ophidiomyces ophidiicola]